jgi:hypothetical protein
LDFILLAEVRFVNAVNLCKLDALFFQLGSSFLIMGSEGLAMTAPTRRTSLSVIFLRVKVAKYRDHGAKNSRRTRDSLVTVSKLLGVTSITSEGPSATARVTRARAVRERRREENFMTGEERESERK